MNENVIEVSSLAEFERSVLGSEVPVLVDFWAPWCGPCRTMGPILDELATEHAGDLIVAKVNVDTAQTLAGRYEVLSIPTLLVVSAGEVQKRLVGALPKGTLMTELSAWLAA